MVGWFIITSDLYNFPLFLNQPFPYSQQLSPIDIMMISCEFMEQILGTKLSDSKQMHGLI